MDTRTLSRYAFFAFLFLLPFQTVFLLREPFVGGEKWQYGVIGVYFSDAFLLATICFFVIASRFWEKIKDAGCKIMEKGTRDLSSLILILLVGWALLSIFWAQDQTLAGYFFTKLLLGAGVFFFARSLDDTDVRTAIRILLVAAVLQVTIATGQFLWQTSPASTLLGMSAHDAWQAGNSVLKNETGRWLRAYGSFPHPNVLGGFLSVVLVVGIGYRIFQTRIKDAEYRMQGHASLIMHHLSCITYHASLILILLGLILTFSRTAWLGAVIGIAAYYVIGYVTGKRRGPMSYRPLLVLGVAMAVFVFVLRDQVFPRFDTAIIEKEGSVSERTLSLRDAEALIVEHPFLGVGAGNFTAAIIENGSGRPIWSVQPAHNVFVLVLAELGIVGLLLFVGFVVSVIAVPVRRLWRSIGQTQDAGYKMQNPEKNASTIIYHAPFILGFLTLVPSIFLDHWLWTSHFGIFLLFILAGLAARGKR